MDKFISLADALGINPDAALGTETGAQAPTPRQKTTTIKALCREILSSQEYKEHLYRLIVRDAVPPAIEQMLYHYAEGKPIERLEVSEVPSNLEDLSVEELEARISRLHERVKMMRLGEEFADVTTPHGAVN